jgi:hypothetical protein
MSKKEDLKFGLVSEEKELERLKKFFDKPQLKKVKEKYFVFDFACEDLYVELKSRRSTHDKYPDTMVGKNKIDYAKHTTRPVCFVFSFTDGLYYWKYNESDIGENVTFRKGGRFDRGRAEVSDYAYIKTSVLEKIPEEEPELQFKMD